MRRTSDAAFSVSVIGKTFVVVFVPSSSVSVDMVHLVGWGVFVSTEPMKESYTQSAADGSRFFPVGRGVLLFLVILDGRLDGVLGQHRAVNLHRRQGQLLD